MKAVLAVAAFSVCFLPFLAIAGQTGTLSEENGPDKCNVNFDEMDFASLNKVCARAAVIGNSVNAETCCGNLENLILALENNGAKCEEEFFNQLERKGYGFMASHYDRICSLGGDRRALAEHDHDHAPGEEHHDGEEAPGSRPTKNGASSISFSLVPTMGLAMIVAAILFH